MIEPFSYYFVENRISFLRITKRSKGRSMMSLWSKELRALALL